MNNTDILAAFNNHIIEFFDDIIRFFPDNSDIKLAKTTLITMGENGAVIDNSGNTFSIFPYHAGSVVDTTGAGDAFKGGFLHGLLENMSPEKAAHIGNISAGITITERGAINSMPYKSEVYKILADMDT